MNLPKLGQRVTHVVEGSSTGMITAVCERASGMEYEVIWSDFTRRWHAITELEPHVEKEKPLGFSKG